MKDVSMMNVKYFPYLDIVKIISCIGIVAIHALPFYYNEWIQVRFSDICPVFVSTFFVVSSLLFWTKIKWDVTDWNVLKHFTMRLLVLYLSWGIILSPWWVSISIHHNPDTWWWVVPLKFFVSSGTHGSWFIMSLIYGTWLCYFLNRYINKHLVFVFLFFVWLYYSLVRYNNMEDVLGIYFQNDVVNAFYSPIRSIFWIECSFYIPSILKIDKINKRDFLTYIIILLLTYMSYSLLVNGSLQFIANAIIAVFMPILCCRQGVMENSSILVTMRKMTIIVYFTHFVVVSIFHNAYIRGLIPFEYGIVTFVTALSVCGCFAYFLIRLSDKIDKLKYLY